MSRLKRLILEVHRRSLWQVLAVYVGASWAVLEATDRVRDRFLMPDWVYGAAWVVLLVGRPIVLASALVRDEFARPAPEGEPWRSGGGPAGWPDGPRSRPTGPHGSDGSPHGGST